MKSYSHLYPSNSNTILRNITFLIPRVCSLANVLSSPNFPLVYFPISLLTTLLIDKKSFNSLVNKLLHLVFNWIKC